MTEQIEPPSEDFEPVSKRTRHSGVVKSIGDPLLTDRSKVASIFLSKKEKLEKQYKKDTELLRQSTQMRMNDWKSVIGVEKDASKVCPVFHKAQQVVSSVKPAPIAATIADPVLLPLFSSTIVPAPLFYLEPPAIELQLRAPTIQTSLDPDVILHQTLSLINPSVVDLSTPSKPQRESNIFPEIPQSLQSACIDALSACSPAYIPGLLFSNSKCWSATRLQPSKPHSLARWLSKWRDEDTAVKKNKVAPVFLIVGPTGCGKTSLVYACCAELDMEVLEVSPSDFSWEANGRRPVGETAREALQSRRAGSSSSQIVLIDDVDVLVTQDKSVITAIAAMTSDSKRPLVLTATDDNSALSELADEIFHIKPVNDINCAFLIWAYRTLFHSGCFIGRTDIDRLAQQCKGDLRKVAMTAEMDPIVEDSVDTKDKQIPTRCPSSLHQLIQPFFFISSWIHLYRKTGETCDAMRMMAQLSKAPAFSSRRIRCILDLFNAPSQIDELRAMNENFPN